jgi:uroporphyrin-III C-methyltransferase
LHLEISAMKLINKETIQKNYKGKVILAGAGSGDPDLITVKALWHIQNADVILTDRLVSPELVSENAKFNAEIVYVGKQCSKGIHTPQSDINYLLVKYANQNKHVLRLKGGDASLFSNILDELETLKKHNILYEIIPGISAAFGAAAYTGIPLTARNHSRGVRFLTLCELTKIKENVWLDYATTEDTLVFYMSGQQINLLISKLIAAKTNDEKKLAIVQQATTPEQQTEIISLKNWDENEERTFKHVPTLIIFGKVVNLHKSFNWLKEKNLNTTHSYFDQNVFQNN